MNADLLPVLLIIIPLGTAFLTTLIATFSKKIARYLPLMGVLAMVIIAIFLLIEVVNSGSVTSVTGFQDRELTDGGTIPLGIHLVATPLGALVALGMSGVALFVLTSHISDSGDRSEPWFSLLVMMATAGAVGMVITGDLFNLFVFLEITSISGTSLAALPRGKVKKGLNWKGALGYAIISALASFLILAGIALIYGATQTLNMGMIPARLLDADPFLIGTALILMLVGFGIEAEVFPLNGWAPDVYKGSRWGTSSIFSGVIGKAGLVAMIKVVLLMVGPALDGSLVADILLWGGAATFLVGEAAAFTSKDIYRLLGFSSIGMFGLMLVAFSLGSENGIWAGVFLILGHMILKPVLFSITGRITDRDTNTPLSKLDGLMDRSKTGAFLFGGAAIMLLGMPPSPIFWGKFYMINEIGAQGNWLLLGVILLGTLLEAGFIGRLLWRVFSGNGENGKTKIPFLQGTTAAVALGLSAAIGFMPGIIEPIINSIAEDLLGRWFQ
ncbi:MAG: proton-conducting transporter membrane subunit [Candidatus Thermoplasmatota archaeon]|nr:proton-conducting transporter membrane subunit [Candidatus Thermoplasmatota archaeon]